MARQIIDLPSISPEELNRSDLLFVRDKNEKKDKKLEVGSLKTSQLLADLIEALTSDGDYMIKRKNGEISVEKYEPYIGGSYWVCHEGSTRTSSTTLNQKKAIGKKFRVTNSSGRSMKVLFSMKAMINSSGVTGRFYVGKEGDDSVRFSDTTYSAAMGFWYEHIVSGDIIVPPNSYVDLRGYMYIESGSGSITVCDDYNDDSAGYGMRIATWFGGFV